MTRLVIGPSSAEHIALVLPEPAKNPEGWYQAHAQIRVDGVTGDISFFLELSDVAGRHELVPVGMPLRIRRWVAGVVHPDFHVAAVGIRARDDETLVRTVHDEVP